MITDIHKRRGAVTVELPLKSRSEVPTNTQAQDAVNRHQVRLTHHEETSMGNLAMGNLSVSSGPDASVASSRNLASTNQSAPTQHVAAISARGELARQRPSDAGYILQQFVRLAGAQCRMSAEEVAYHNRTHEQRKAS